MLFIWQGGQVLYGGVIFGGAAALVWLLKKKLPVLSVMDLVMAGALVGIGFGRIGCLGSGCCFGEPWSGLFSLHFPPESVAYQEQLAQGIITADAVRSAGCWPTQIFASLFAFAAAGCLALLEKPFRPRPGLLFGAGLAIYGCGRWFEETLRVNPRIAGFSVAQWTSFVLIALGLGLVLSLLLRKRPGSPEG
jgi:phosphatidylglycerol:prolipoprotein diacylglycerol transferase